MPTYPVKHKETGETKELIMSMKDYDQWRKDILSGIRTGHKVVLVLVK